VRDPRVACEACCTNYYSPSPAERAGINWAPTWAPISARRARRERRGTDSGALRKRSDTADDRGGRRGSPARVIFVTYRPRSITIITAMISSRRTRASFAGRMQLSASYRRHVYVHMYAPHQTARVMINMHKQVINVNRDVGSRMRGVRGSREIFLDANQSRSARMKPLNGS